ncbi:MAG: alpha-1,2-fucosyltransferase [Cyclobacteriaceae bacterium]
MTKPLIVFTHGGGRLANQMINHAHLVAFQAANAGKLEVINLAMGPFTSLFESFYQGEIPSVPLDIKRANWFRKIMSKVVAPREYKMSAYNQILRLLHLFGVVLPGFQSIKVGIAPGFLAYLPGQTFKQFDLSSDAVKSIVFGCKVSLFAGWPIRSWKLFSLHQQSIRKAFQIKNVYADNANQFIKEKRKGHELVIGVLMRQDDYRTWKSGKYFFENEVYYQWMNEVIRIFYDQRVAFIIASDEKKDMVEFKAITAFLCTGQAVGSSHFIESMAELSMCDYVMTPPSTFGVWAAFMGDVPIIPLFEREQKIEESQFLTHHIFDCIDHPHMSISIK